MTDLDELDIVIRQGDRVRTVPVASLAAVLRLPSTTIRTSLARLLFASFDRDTTSDPTATREPTEGVGNVGSVTNVTYGSPQKDNSPRRERDGGERGGSGEGRESPLDVVALATALDDLVHLDVLAALVARHPRARVERALTITLARPPNSIRTTRGAYFTGVLRALAAREGTPPQLHARIHSNTP